MAVLVVGLTSFENARQSGLAMRACRFLETYQNASEISFVSRIALSLMVAQAAERDQERGKI